MTRDEHLLTTVMEECAEISQRAAKALRFGLEQIQQDADDKPEQNPDRLTNRERIVEEYYDLRATLGMVGIDAWETSERSRRAEAAKVEKVERYLRRSERCGTLVAPPPERPQEWQPMETAPNDGAFFIALDAKGGVRKIRWCTRFEPAGWADADGFYTPEAIGWMPLPSAPHGAAKESA